MQKKQSPSLPEFLLRPNPEIYRSNNYVVLDFETTNLEKGSSRLRENKIVLAVWGLGRDHPEYNALAGANLYSKRAGEFELSELVVACEQADFIVAHNAKFELGWLERAGLDLTNVIVFDTMLAEYVLLGNRRLLLNLNDVAERYSIGGKMGVVSHLIHSGICPSEIPAGWLLKYCEQDVLLCERLFELQRDLLGEANLLPVLFTRCLLTPVLVDIEKHGLKVDHERVRKLYDETEKEYIRITKLLDKATGGINTNSPKQLAEFLYDELGFEELKDRRGNPLRTAKGGRKTDAGTLELLNARNKRQREFLELRKQQAKLNGRLTKYLNKLLECCEQSDGILHANFNQTRTRNHRTSSTGAKHSIQLQNIDRDFKCLFTARNPDWLVGEVDGAQLEFRVAVYLGQDEKGMYDIRNKVDKHTFTSETLTNAGQPTNRQDAKPHTFKPLYGGMSGTDAEVTYYKAFQERHNQLFKVQMGWCHEVLKTKKLVTPWGLIFYWPDTKMTRSGFITNTQAIFNYPVSSLSTAEIIPIAIVYLWHWMKAYQMLSFLVNTIHDSGIAEIFPPERELFESLAVKSFTDHVYEYLYKVYGLRFNVPLGAGVKVGTHWSEGTEVKHESEPLYN